MVGLAEVLVLLGVVVLLFALLRPLRRRLELRFARWLRPVRRAGRLIVLDRRRDGTFGRGGRHGG